MAGGLKVGKIDCIAQDPLNGQMKKRLIILMPTLTLGMECIEWNRGPCAFHWLKSGKSENVTMPGNQHRGRGRLPARIRER